MTDDRRPATDDRRPTTALARSEGIDDRTPPIPPEIGGAQGGSGGRWTVVVLIGALLVAFLVLATLYSAAVPLGEGPDEPGHAAYAFFLARVGRLPVQRADPRQSDVPGEGHQPPLAYALAAPLLAWLPPQERQLELPGNPRFIWSGGVEVNAAAHGSREYPPWQGAVLAWHLMRLVSAALGAVTVFFTYLVARAIDCRLQIADCRLRSAMPLLAAGLVAFNPQFLFVSALVTNDALLTALSAVLLWLVVKTAAQRTTDHGPRTTDHGRPMIRNVIAIGLVLGLALLTKQSAVILAPIAALAVIAWPEDQRGRAATREATERSEGRLWRSLVRHPSTHSPVHAFDPFRGLLVIGIAALVAGWWYIRNWRLYGDLLGLAAFRGEFATQSFQVGSPGAWIAGLAQLHASFWARFGWMNVAPPAWAIWLIAALELAAVAGLLLAARTRRLLDRTSVVGPFAARKGRRRSSVVGHWSLVALPALVFVWVVSFALTAGLVAWQGRLLFPALPAIATLLARGLTAWGSREPTNDKRRTTNERSNRWSLVVGHWSLVMGVLILGSLFLLALWIPEGVIRPAYPLHTLSEAVAQSRIGTPANAKFRQRGERSVELRGWRIEGPARPGATLDVTLMWYAVARQSHDWVIFIHLVDRQDRIVAEDNRPPRDDAFPMTQWAVGDWVEDRHQLRLPPDVAAGAYTLRVGLYDPKRNDRRAGVYQGGKLRGDALDLGHIMLAGDN